MNALRRKCAPSTSGWPLSSPASSPLRSSRRRGPRPLPPDSRYPHSKRLRAVFAAALANPTPPSLVGNAIRQIVDGDSWQLRYPVGPDALPVLKSRASKTDEQVISEAAESDAEFIARVKREYRLDLTL